MIEANSGDAVISPPSKLSSSKNLSTLNGSKSWCWTSNSSEPYFHIHFKEYAVLCAFNFTLNGFLELTYGNEVSNNSKVSIYNMYIFFISYVFVKNMNKVNSQIVVLRQYLLITNFAFFNDCTRPN